MRYVELTVTDCLEAPATTRTEWIHRGHIESIEAWTEEQPAGPVWLELTLTSGRTRYVPIGAEPGQSRDAAAAHAVRTLLDGGQLPVAAAR